MGFSLSHARKWDCSRTAHPFMCLYWCTDWFSTSVSAQVSCSDMLAGAQLCLSPDLPQLCLMSLITALMVEERWRARRWLGTLFWGLLNQFGDWRFTNQSHLLHLEVSWSNSKDLFSKIPSSVVLLVYNEFLKSSWSRSWMTTTVLLMGAWYCLEGGSSESCFAGGRWCCSLCADKDVKAASMVPG